MSCGWLLLGVAAVGLHGAPSQIEGAHWSSCGTSYCRGIEPHCTPQVPASSILNRPTGHGYSVKYNYGLQPDWANASSFSGSSAYNYGTSRYNYNTVNLK